LQNTLVRRAERVVVLALGHAEVETRVRALDLDGRLKVAALDLGEFEVVDRGVELLG
jgi:hypothetical protein